MADKSKMSVAEMLAAARKKDGSGDASAADAAPASDGDAASAASSEAAAAESSPAPSAAKKAASGGPMSVAEMLAAARGGGSAPAAKPAPKPAAKPAAAKAAPKKEAAAAASAAVDTQSILAAARSGAKPGPMTKAEAAAKGQALPAKKPAAKETIVVPPMPVKPAYAKPAAKQTGDVAERRAFLFGLSALATGFVAMGATIALWTLGSVRFMFPNVLRLPPSRFKVGFPDQFASGQVEEKYKAQFGVWIVNTEYNGQQEIFALKSVCTHLGCTPNWLEAEQKFKCPCHGSGFYKDGINFEGPAPRPLERYAVSIANDGQLEVDKNRTFFEEKGDWADPASYIPA